MRFAALFAVLAIPALCEAAVPAVTTTDATNPFVAAAHQAYLDHLAAEIRGDLEAYKRSRAQKPYDEMVDRFKAKSIPPQEWGPLLKKISRSSMKLDGFRFIRADGSGDHGRLFYRRDYQEEDGSKTIVFLGYQVLLEEGAWKVGCVVVEGGGDMTVDLASKALVKRTESTVAAHKCLSER